jgi:hypothetical protein
LAQNTTADTENSSNTVIHELREIKASLIEESSSAFWSDIRDTILSVLGIGVPVIIAIYLFWLDQETKRKHTIQRSCDTLLRELGQAGESFQNDETRIRRSYFDRSPQIFTLFSLLSRDISKFLTKDFS